MDVVQTRLDLLYDTVNFTVRCKDTDDLAHLLDWCRSNLGKEYVAWSVSCVDNYLLFDVYIRGIENGSYFRLCQ